MQRQRKIYHYELERRNFMEYNFDNKNLVAAFSKCVNFACFMTVTLVIDILICSSLFCNYSFPEQEMY